MLPLAGVRGWNLQDSSAVHNKLSGKGVRNVVCEKATALGLTGYISVIQINDDSSRRRDLSIVASGTHSTLQKFFDWLREMTVRKNFRLYDSDRPT